MEKSRLSQLLKIISSESIGESDSNSGTYDSKHKLYDRDHQKARMRRENYKNGDYMKHKNLNKLGR